jgi:hypothetical protein
VASVGEPHPSSSCYEHYAGLWANLGIQHQATSTAGTLEQLSSKPIANRAQLEYYAVRNVTEGNAWLTIKHKVELQDTTCTTPDPSSSAEATVNWVRASTAHNTS